ncbi:MAG: metallophosphoesterase [Fimbriimonadaceae bacterium]|nr:metallophosphoesterase [Fimbriimonadaceae bacterium]
MNRRSFGLTALGGLTAGCLRAAPPGTAGLTFQTAVPAQPLDVILARPGADRLTWSVLAYQPLRAELVVTPAGGPARRCGLRDYAAGQPQHVEVAGLQPGTGYTWQLQNAAQQVVAQGRAQTQRPRGQGFTFTISADSHLDENTAPELYAQTLRNALADGPDFHLDLGDTFMGEKYAGDYHAAAAQYLAQRYYFGLLGHSAPVFLALGNHDGELGWLYQSQGENVATWSCQQRQRYFANPVPGGIYRGNGVVEPGCGLLQNYYAWEWGDALLVVLDPFWPTRRKPTRQDVWARTLGETQYRWLQETLRGSRAALKLVFIHHLVGGDPNGRGGVEWLHLGEWGGQHADRSPGFATQRPGWPQPIHDLLRETGVRAVFHGHDHFYCQQERDGIVYHLLPQPGHPGRRSTNPAQEYGYVEGHLVDGSGHLRVQVAPGGPAQVDFIQALLPAAERPNYTNRRVAASYRLTPS